MLQPRYSTDDRIECGCDEVGRGCLAGPVVAAAVVLPPDFSCDMINDSKQLSEIKREQLSNLIKAEAIAWAIAEVSPGEIDRINILQASFWAMHKAVAALSIRPELLLVDGNRFKPYEDIPHHCVIHGDALYQNIAAASILAKTYRDGYMREASLRYVGYGWETNVGYPTKEHKAALERLGPTPLHRLSFGRKK
ncbi:MAG: ribonuclease HII [Porphyromonas sp.]|nr:ribonuclease HII [Porphyromonas sp.]